MTVSVAVMAHPRRRDFVAELLDQLDRPAEVVWDRHGDRWETGRRAMLAHDPEATHHAVIQDDAIVCRDLIAGVEQALAHVPEKTPLGLYVGRVRPYRDLVQQAIDAAGPGTSWLTMDQLLWGVGVVMPTHLIGDLLTWCDIHGEIANYDKRISQWLQRQGIPVLYPWPSLVDHRDSPSLVPGRGSAGRRAHRFLGADESALAVNWAGTVLDLDGWRLRRRTLSTVASPTTSADRAASHRPSTERGVTVKFVSTKYPELQVYTARVRFRRGVAEVTSDTQIAELLTLRHMGVVPAEEADSEPEPTGTSAPAAAADVDTAVPKDAAGGEAVTPNAPDAAVIDPVPDGGAKEVLSWVADDAGRAQRALDAEQAREKPRSTLAAALTKLAG